MNLQCTVTLAILTAGGSTPFDTVHLYSPSFSLVTLFKFSFGVDESTSLPPPTLVQVMLGWGFPVALQNRTVLFPSNKVTSAGATSTVGGSERRNRTSYPNKGQNQLSCETTLSCSLSVCANNEI